MCNPLQSILHWVPIEERLPDDTRHVLVAIEGHQKPAYGQWFEGHWLGISGRFPDRYKVLMWADLPEVPIDG